MEYEDKVYELAYAWADIMFNKPSKKSIEAFEKELILFGVSEEDVFNMMSLIRNKEGF